MSTTTALVQAQVDRELKLEAEKILAAEGLTVSDAIQMLLISTVQDQGIPVRRFRPNAETREAIDAMDRGEYKTFETVEDLMADLNAED